MFQYFFLSLLLCIVNCNLGSERTDCDLELGHACCDSRDLAVGSDKISHRIDSCRQRDCVCGYRHGQPRPTNL